MVRPLGVRVKHTLSKTHCQSRDLGALRGGNNHFLGDLSESAGGTFGILTLFNTAT